MVRSVVMLVTCSVALTGCGLFDGFDRVLPDRRTDYQRAESLPDLEVPPELTTDAIQDRLPIPAAGSSNFATFQDRTAQSSVSEAPGGAAQPPANPGVRLVDAGGGRTFLRLDATVADSVQAVTRALNQAGVKITDTDAAAGLIEVNQPPAGQTDEKKGVLSRLKFWGKDKGTDYRIHLTDNAGLTELTVHDSNDAWDTSVPAQQFVSLIQQNLRITPRASFAAPVEAARPIQQRPAAPVERPAPPVERATTTNESQFRLMNAGSGRVFVRLAQPVPAALASVSAALMQAGVEVTESDQSAGVLEVRLPPAGAGDEKKGVLSRLKFWGKDKGTEYRIHLTDNDGVTEMTVHDMDDNWDTSEPAQEFVNLIYQNLQ
ncbi:MAG: outer membrane protein assembly factor BamC [Gammaproteobacteria bacterium]|nr:outer membrane protein assembly factor BamC [Gammaproteobacteria bacterium]